MCSSFYTEYHNPGVKRDYGKEPNTSSYFIDKFKSKMFI